MIFDLVETKFEKIKGIYLLDIDKDDVDIIPKIIITCPCDKNINGNKDQRSNIVAQSWGVKKS